ncbi:MAG: hypothetical protein U5R14_07465 [Gemmatimonadota bacterium]|nr:hypothetical protein [Gemmatimonadota bacterium]
MVSDDGSRLAGDLHLHPNTLAPGGYESALAMVNNDERFFPVSAKDGTVALIGKRRTVSVSYSAPEGTTAGDDPEGEVEPDRVPLEVLLSDGTKLTGWALVDLPKEYPRALDFLNGSGTFVRIRDEARVHLVNRAHIRTAHPLD